MLKDITKDIRDGRYPSPLSFRSYTKVFGRRVFVKLQQSILLGNIQYTIDKKRDTNLLIVYIDFNSRRNKKHRSITYSINLIIKEYIFFDTTLFMKRIRYELINYKPQPIKDIRGKIPFQWSFNANDLL